MQVSRLILTLCIFGVFTQASLRASEVENLLPKLELKKGIVAVAGISPSDTEAIVDACVQSELIIFAQAEEARTAKVVREAADKAGLLGTRLFVEQADSTGIHLGTNVADSIVVGSEQTAFDESEILRVLRPRGIAFIGDQRIVKPVPEGTDPWSHPYHRL